jgi:hypothetical protein
VQDLKPFLLERLRENPELDAKLRADAYTPIEKGGRTAQAYEVWREDYLEQVAVAWVLACVFVRYLEDNALIAETYLAGLTPDRRRAAEDAHLAYVRSQPTDPNDRDYLLSVFRRVGSIPAAKDLFSEGKTPLWALGPTGDGAKRLLDFWQKIDPETGSLLRTFPAESGDTRLLGDLYQDLSEAARRDYALLQTPEFVEEFILDYTLTPAIAEFGLETVRLLDPACGSGHFLIGAFRRLFQAWSQREPGSEPTVLAERILKDQVAGVDLNPFAVAIARFRLVVEAMHACGIGRLGDAPGWRVEVVVGDSLMHGPKFDRRGHDEGWLPGMETWADSIYAIDDPDGLKRVLGRQYHAVVGNPPYITVKDAKVSERYRKRWDSCYRQYSLGVPFTERFFNLAMAADGTRPAGYVGMITANSFMKREFGKKLIEEFLTKVDLTHIIDTSGAHIPGHGTPTVILVGRNRNPVANEVRAVLGIRGEPTTPVDPANGLVWRAIVDHLNDGDAVNDFVSVTNVRREVFGKHPWSMGGGGAADIKTLLDEKAANQLHEVIEEIGFGAVTREDEVFLVSEPVALRHGIALSQIRPLVAGEDVRNWAIQDPVTAIWPYDFQSLASLGSVAIERFLWPWRIQLSDRVAYGQTQLARGLKWFEYSMFFRARFRTALSITFAEVATHNHFALDRGGKVFNRTAPIIKLRENSAEDYHLALLGLLNSSTGGFWLRQVSFPKGGSGMGRGVQDEAWEMRFAFDGTKVGMFPITDATTETLPLARELDTLASRIGQLSPAKMIKQEVPTAQRLASNRAETERLQARMVALQEELDWLVYRLYGLMEPDAGRPGCDEPYPDPPGLNLGERPFEIALARRIASGDETSAWFERHGSTPITGKRSAEPSRLAGGRQASGCA